MYSFFYFWLLSFWNKQINFKAIAWANWMNFGKWLKRGIFWIYHKNWENCNNPNKLLWNYLKSYWESIQNLLRFPHCYWQVTTKTISDCSTICNFCPTSSFQSRSISRIVWSSRFAGRSHGMWWSLSLLIALFRSQNNIERKELSTPKKQFFLNV